MPHAFDADALLNHEQVSFALDVARGEVLMNHGNHEHAVTWVRESKSWRPCSASSSATWTSTSLTKAAAAAAGDADEELHVVVAQQSLSRPEKNCGTEGKVY